MLVLLLLLGACGSSHSPEDAAPADTGRADTGPRCRSDVECADDTFCNGRELCRPEDPRADSFGCAPGLPACVDGLVCTIEHEPICDEAERRCGESTIDHARCPDGFACRRTFGCVEADRCGASGCPEVDGDPCTIPECDVARGSVCVEVDAPTGTACDAPGGAGFCISGSCEVGEL
jgi:hypothetical protein